MSTAVIRKTARDSAWLILAITLGVIFFEAILVRALGELPSEAAQMLQWKTVNRLMRMLLGADLSAALNATTLVTIGLGHPLIYALTWTLVLTICTRVTAGEMDRGTADLLLTLPISRGDVYASSTVVWVLAGIPATLAAIAGIWIGGTLWPLRSPIQYGHLWPVIVNLFALYVSVGGVTMLLGSALGRPGPALAVVLAGLLGSFLLNYLVTLWPEVEPVARFGLLHYYRPLPSVRDQLWPVRDLGVLAGVGAVAWAAGLWTYSRRDIPAS
jgi:putative exporter of polyketide antibiotics